MPMTPDIDYEQIFMQAPIGMCVSRHRIIHSANATLEAVFDVTSGTLAGRSFSVLYPSVAEFEHTGSRLIPLLKPTGFHADERIMKRVTGELFWCRVTGRSLIPDDPHALGIWTFEDLGAKRPVAPSLTAREREVATLIAEGQTSKMIARQLDLSPRTVEMYRARLMSKFSAPTSSALIHKLMRPEGG